MGKTIMELDLATIVTYLIIGAIAGTAAAALLEKSSRRKGQWLRNTLIGVLGAIVGQFIFDLLDIKLTGFWEEASLSLADVLVAFVGAVFVIFIIGILRR
ncbi:MAG: GlsB/YeaQ/YmgE family stress response membrane protein [Anaerolineae bacterium]|nr:GlsB/YeaQ/YmgE family stress response membrane protein [Anaerolineae bacterium]